MVDTPNHLGIAEMDPVAGEWCLVPPPGRLPAVELRQVRRLQKRLASCTAIAPYHRHVVAPWFTMLASRPAVLTTPVAGGIAAVPLGGAFPDVPGGVRIEISADATTADLSGYAAAVEERARDVSHR